MSSNPNYHSYLLRLWRDGADLPWRASVQCTATGEKRAFADILTLFAFLVEQVAVDENADEHARFATWLQAQIADTGPQSGNYTLSTQSKQEHFYETATC